MSHCLRNSLFSSFMFERFHAFWLKKAWQTKAWQTKAWKRSLLCINSFEYKQIWKSRKKCVRFILKFIVNVDIKTTLSFDLYFWLQQKHLFEFKNALEVLSFTCSLSLFHSFKLRIWFALIIFLPRIVFRRACMRLMY